MVNVARKREWKLASDILLTESFLSESFFTVFSQVEIPLNNEQDGDCLSETIMVTLVVCENIHKHIGARPLMLPIQQTDICIATQKRNINEWLQIIGFVLFFY